MDVFDIAAEIGATYNQAPHAAVTSRDLTEAEFAALLAHLVDTEMMPLDAAQALHLTLDRLTLADFDRLSQHLARCNHCNTWTRLPDLVNSTCPDCLSEQDGQ